MLKNFFILCKDFTHTSVYECACACSQAFCVSCSDMLTYGHVQICMCARSLVYVCAQVCSCSSALVQECAVACVCVFVCVCVNVRVNVCVCARTSLRASVRVSVCLLSKYLNQFVIPMCQQTPVEAPFKSCWLLILP